MSRCVCIEVAGRAGGTNVMNVFANEEKQRVSGSGRQRDRPPSTVAQTFWQNRKERYAEERAGRQTDQRAKRLVRQLERRADRSTDKGEGIGRDDLPQSDLPVQEVASDS